MSREIKFRVWDTTLKAWIVEPTFFGGNKIFVARGNMLVEVKNAVAQQFTGLLDSRGTEIYEGDTVRVNIPTRGNYPADYEQKVLTVEWDNEGADYNGLGFEGASYEVLGNIYQDPFLLEHA